HEFLESLTRHVLEAATVRKTCKYRLEINIYGRKVEFKRKLLYRVFPGSRAVLVTGASQSRQHESHHRFFPVDTSLIHIESRKSPTKSLFDVGSRRISIFTVNTKEYHSDVLAIITRIMRRTY
ncbi:hypothetical protein Tco_0548591, partial [Tanacetum coccineum]